ncbi:hypothetical protein [Paraburkholderia sp.]|uniref:hypothetical protein n=1 Tax=Paraburkholderia sp. TaxID=1926495 RepID=UPI00286F14AA|nr:hypothetical protein [Paraburkholderia sp.]
MLNEVDRKMSEQNKNLGTGIWLYGYAVALGVLYVFAFSRPFGFNLFAFFSIQDYLSTPLNRSVIIVALPALIATVFFEKIKSVSRGLEKAGFYFLMLMYVICFVSEAHRAVDAYISIKFHFRNEINVIVLMCSAILVAALVAIRSRRSDRPLIGQLAALFLAQIAVISAAGYADGKSIYAGADEVYFLENKDLCGSIGNGSWVYVARLSATTVFMNTSDKRLCFTDEKKYRLISRVRLESLDQD